MKDHDIIAAIATPPGEGGVGIIRISGPGALEAALKIFRPKSAGAEEITPARLYYGHMVDGEDQRILDDGFLVYMKGPRSYTGEDVVELHCHGGPLVLRCVLEEVLRRGARLAEPGEFTKRAFLNGRLDLARAEAVIDVIRAGTEAALSAARGRLAGRFSRRVNEIKEMLLDLTVRIEAELDFSEQEVEPLSSVEIFKVLEEAGKRLEKLISTYNEGSALRYGIKTLILGRPNVGKSSLLNVLLRKDRAIVTPFPGTTRDIIEETVNIRGLPLRLMDTAGLRKTPDHVESIGIRRTLDSIESAGLVLFVVDSSAEDFSEDIELLGRIEARKVMVVANKADLIDDRVRKKVKKAFSGCKVVFISALRETGIEELEDAVFEKVTGRGYGTSRCGDVEPGEFVASIRHRNSLALALEALERVRAAVEKGLEREFVAADLRGALNRLGEITGEITTEDILDRIFSEFCIGK